MSILFKNPIKLNRLYYKSYKNEYEKVYYSIDEKSYVEAISDIELIELYNQLTMIEWILPENKKFEYYMQLAEKNKNFVGAILVNYILNMYRQFGDDFSKYYSEEHSIENFIHNKLYVINFKVKYTYDLSAMKCMTIRQENMKIVKSIILLKEYYENTLKGESECHNQQNSKKPINMLKIFLERLKDICCSSYIIRH